MNTLAVVFCYKRPNILRHCAHTLFTNTERGALPDEVVFIDDGSGAEVTDVLLEIAAAHGSKAKVTLLTKSQNLGFSDSARWAFAAARARNPRHLYMIEADYVFAAGGLAAVRDVLENTQHGRDCFGICGYDHPDFYRQHHRETAYPAEMLAQIGEDNVNRAALWQPFHVAGIRQAYQVERVSNSCFSSYLNWQHICAVAVEFPELAKYIELAASPQPIPGFPPSGQYAAARVVDDAMLSNGLNLVWNRWAERYGIDRSRFSAWLNIKPSVADHISGGGLHTGAGEMSTDAHSPSFFGRV